MEDITLPKCEMFGELVGGEGFAGAGNGVDGMSSKRPQSFRHQDQPERSETVKTRGRILHGELDSGRESLGCTVVCSSVSERDGKYLREGSLIKVRSCWFACRYCFVEWRELLPLCGHLSVYF